MKKLLFALLTLATAIAATGQLKIEQGTTDTLQTNGPTTYSHTLTFSPADLTITQEEHEGQLYSVISMGNTDNWAEVGEPELPVYGFNISVPQFADGFEISTSVNGTETIKLDYLPLPAQTPRTTAYYEEADYGFDAPKAKVYSAKSSYPAAVAELGESILVKGFSRVVSVLVHPVAWNPVSNQLTLATDMTVTVSWTVNRSEEKEKQILMPKFQDVVNAGLESTREMVVNPEDVSRWLETGQTLKASPLNPSTDHPTYAVITPREFAEPAKRLAAIRKVRGITPIVVYLEDILSDPAYGLGDYISGLNDDAGKLRGYLQHAYADLGITDVVLLGDYPMIPGRWAKFEDAKNEFIFKYISDSYFANLSKKWELDSEGYQLISGFRCTGYEVNVGRIPGRTTEEFDEYIDKLLQYEFNKYDEDRSYLGKAFVFVGSDEKIEEEYHNRANAIKSLLDVTELITSRDGKKPGAKIIETMNKAQYGYVEFCTHGLYGGVISYTVPREVLNNTIYLDYGISAYDDRLGGLMFEDLNGLDCWKNRHYPTWSASMSCSLAEMGQERDQYNFVRSYLMHKDYGGIVFMGNTDRGYKGNSDKVVKAVFELLNSNTGSGSESYAGKIFTDGKSRTNTIPDTPHDHVLATMTLFGDPKIPLWSGTPHKSNLPNGSFSGSDIDDWETVMVGEYNFPDGTAASYSIPVKDAIKASPKNNSTLMFYRHNMEPFIHPVTIKNLMVARNDNWFTRDLKIASTDQPGVSLTVAEAKTLNVEAIGDVDIEGNMRAENEGKISILGHHQISCSGIICQGNGEIILESQEATVLLPGFEVKEGATIEIKSSNTK